MVADHFLHSQMNLSLRIFELLKSSKGLLRWTYPPLSTFTPKMWEDSVVKHVHFLQVNLSQKPNAGFLKIFQNNSDFYLDK